MSSKFGLSQLTCSVYRSWEKKFEKCLQSLPPHLHENVLPQFFSFVDNNFPLYYQSKFYRFTFSLVFSMRKTSQKRKSLRKLHHQLLVKSECLTWKRFLFLMMKVLSSRPIRCKTINSSGSISSTPWNCRESEGCRVLQTSVDKTITLFVFFYWSWKIDVFRCEKRQGTSWPSYFYFPTFWIAVLHLILVFWQKHRFSSQIDDFVVKIYAFQEECAEKFMKTWDLYHS